MIQEFYIHQAFARGALGVNIVGRENRTTLIGQPIQLVEVPPDEIYVGHEAAFYLRPDEAQNLMDELWRCGVRPSEGAGSAGSLRQAESHIASLRAIAFKLAGVEGRV